MLSLNTGVPQNSGLGSLYKYFLDDLFNFLDFNHYLCFSNSHVQSVFFLELQIPVSAADQKLQMSKA